MRSITPRMQSTLNRALHARDGVIYTGMAQARGLVRRGLAVLSDRAVVWNGAWIEVTAAGFALAERDYFGRELRNRDHTEALADLEIGAVVTYRGSKEDEHCFEWIVTGREDRHGGRYVLNCREYPWAKLHLVRRSSFYPTGEQAALCERCAHEHDYCRRDDPDRCATSGCRCDRHAPITVPASEEATR